MGEVGRTSAAGTSLSVGFFRLTLLRTVFVRCVCSCAGARGTAGGCGKCVAALVGRTNEEQRKINEENPHLGSYRVRVRLWLRWRGSVESAVCRRRSGTRLPVKLVLKMAPKYF